MMKFHHLAGATALSALLASSALAQATLVGTQALDDRIDEIRSDIDDDLAEAQDARRFGLPQYEQGWTGSFALGISATSGNTDSGDLSFAGRFQYGAGAWNHTIGLGGEFAEDNGVRNKESVFATYDVNRYLNERFYLFGLGSATYDGFASNELDVFLGGGPGYRVVQTEDLAWRVQAGPGVRYIRDQAGDSSTDLAAVASSRFYRGLSESAFLTNDTDVLWSDTNTLVRNDLGVNFRMTDQLSTRVSYRTDWNSDPLPGLRSTDNRLGVSLVVGF
jgi:putative salt-induced outer membrane protein